MYRATVNGVPLADQLRPAHTHWTRLRGLLGTRRLEPGHGLWIKPSNQVHMFGMLYPIDVVFLDDDGRALRLVHALQPNRISPRVAGASGVLELPAGTLERAGLAEGARIEITGEAPTKPRIRFDMVGTLVANLGLALLYGFFVAAGVSKIATTGQWGSATPLLAQEAMLVGVVLARRRSIATSGRATDWILGIGGTLLPLLMRPAGDLGPLSWLGEPLQFVGVGTAFVALACLGRSFGLVAANRGIKISGLYKFIRHPAYAGYMLGYVGYVQCYPTPRNAVIAVATLLALNARAHAEERFLCHDPSYRTYLRGTRWRFLPLVY